MKSPASSTSAVSPVSCCIYRIASITTLIFSLMITAVFAGSATWKADPIDDNWSNAGNWTPETVPNGPDDVATFANSDTTTVVINAATEIEEMVFQPGPDSFQITLDNLSPMTISGVGMSNQSGRTQVVKTGSSFGGGNEWSFVNSASAGSMMSFIRKFNSKISFYDTATAATASFFNHGPLTITGNYGIYFFAEADAGTATFTNFAENTGSPAFIGFYGSSSAASGTFAGSGDIIFAEESTAANASFSIGGNVFFSGNATATNATFTITDFGSIAFFANATAGNSTINNEGGLVYFNPGGTGGNATITNSDVSATEFYGGTAGNCTLIATGDVAGIYFYAGDGGTSRMELLGNGNLDISESDDRSTTIGSLEGDGSVFLGGNNLTVGSNNLSTTFTGVMQDGGYAGDDPGGSLTKIGTGKLTLTNASTYTGGTIVTSGTLLVNNSAGSGVGKGAVQATAGTLGGDGIISGAVAVGTGGGTGAVLAPGQNSVIPGTLTIRKSLTLKADATYRVTVNSSTPAVDKIIAKAVRISGTQIVLNDGGSGSLPPGTVFTVISNTSADPISGTFSNLANGAIVNVNGNNLQASYTGGDGNDLTLTVVQ